MNNDTSDYSYVKFNWFKFKSVQKIRGLKQKRKEKRTDGVNHHEYDEHPHPRKE